MERDAASAAAVELLHVGLTEWVRHESGARRDEAEQRHVDERTAFRRARLQRIQGEKARLHEIDATLDLLAVSDVSPDLIRDLKQLRSSIVTRCPVARSWGVQKP